MTSKLEAFECCGFGAKPGVELGEGNTVILWLLLFRLFALCFPPYRTINRRTPMSYSLQKWCYLKTNNKQLGTNLNRKVGSRAPWLGPAAFWSQKKNATGANSFLIRASSLITTWSCWFTNASGFVLSIWGREASCDGRTSPVHIGDSCTMTLLIASCCLGAGRGELSTLNIYWAFFLKMSRWSLHFPSLLSCLAGQEKATGKCQPWDQRDHNWGNKKILPP